MAWRKFGNKAQSTEDLKISDKFDFLKEMSILMSIVMILVVGITAIFCRPRTAKPTHRWDKSDLILSY